MEGQRCGKASQARPDDHDMVLVACIGNEDVAEFPTATQRCLIVFEGSPEPAAVVICLAVDASRLRHLLGLPWRRN